MKHHITALATAALLLTACHSDRVSLDDRTDSLSWIMGQNMAQAIQQGQLPNIDRDIFVQALEHTLAGKPQPLTDIDIMRLAQSLSQPAEAPQTAPVRPAADSRETDSQQQAFFNQISKTHPNAKQHPTGFYYEQLTPGHGPNATLAQRIRFDYRSYLLLTGEPYDQTYGRRDPIITVVGSPMFPGLIDGLQLMNAGSKYRFYFPYQLAFGTQGSGSIPGYTPMIYEVELHEIYPD